MWLISTWTCFWLLLKPWMIAGASSLECYSCVGHGPCQSKPYNTVQCKKDANTVCISIAEEHPYGTHQHVLTRQCGTRDFVGQMGGSTDFCKTTTYDQLKAADAWIQGTPDAGLRYSMDLLNETKTFRLCACRSPEKCNDEIGQDGQKHGDGERKDDDDAKDEAKCTCRTCGASGATLHLLSNFAVGSVALFRFVWRAVHSHINGF